MKPSSTEPTLQLATMNGCFSRRKMLTYMQSIEKELKMVRFRIGILVFVLVVLPLAYLLLVLPVVTLS